MEQHNVNLIAATVQEYGWAWLVFAGYLVATWLVAVLARRFLKGVIHRWLTNNSLLDEDILRTMTAPLRTLILTIGLRAALQSLGTRIPSLGAATEFGWVTKGVTALLILSITAFVNALFRSSLDWYMTQLANGRKSAWEKELLPVVRRATSLLLYFVAISIILKNFGQDITALVTTAGIASLAVALAAQDTLSNMIAGFVILIDRPFRVGDVVEFSDGKSGEVTEIGLRSTHIKQFDGNALVVPNKDIAGSRIINYALPDQQAAIRQTIGIDYRADVDQAKRILLEVMTNHPEVLSDPAPGVYFTKLGESALDLFITCWVASYKDRFRVADELNGQILQALRAAGIGIPFPQREVYIHSDN